MQKTGLTIAGTMYTNLENAPSNVHPKGRKLKRAFRHTYFNTMTPAYKVLICKCAMGQVMNADAKTVFSRPALEEVETPTTYRYFDPFAEAGQCAWKLHRADPNLEMSLYSGDEYLQMIPPEQRKSTGKAPQKQWFWSLFKR